MKIFNYKELKVVKFIASNPNKLMKSAILILPGLPASLKEFEFIKQKDTRKFFKEFDIFYIIYPGYPSNKCGIFLQSNPSKLVDDFVYYLKKIKKYEKVYVIGSSFGGSLILYLNNADKIISISPVVDWKNLYKTTDEQNYETLKLYLVNHGYRISNKGWQLLKTGKMFKNPTKKLLKNKSLIIIYGSKDQEIDLENLKRLIAQSGISFIEVKTKEHLSLRKLPFWVIEKISLEIKKDLFTSYNNKYLLSIQEKIKKIKNNKNYKPILYIGITGSLSLGCLTSLSDIDLVIIAEKDEFKKLKKIFQNIQDKYCEVFILTKKDYLEYFTLNIRGCYKFILLEDLFVKDSKLKKNYLLKSKFISNKKFLLLLFSLLEFLRLIKFYKKSNDNLVIHRHSIVSVGTIKWMLVSYGLLINSSNFKFNSLMENLIKDKILSQKEKLLIENFLLTSILNDKTKFDRNLKSIILRYIQFLIYKIQNFYRCRVQFQSKTLTLKLIKKSKIKYFNDIFTALYSSNSQNLIYLYKKYKNKKTLIANIIFYFLSCNKFLPKSIARNIALVEDNVFFRNIKRNLIEYNRFKNDKEILDILSSSLDKKIKYFAKIIKTKKGKKMLNKVIRF